MSAANKNDKYFEESSAGAVAVTSIVVFTLSMAAMLGGIFLTSLAFGTHLDSFQSIAIFVAGLVLCCAGFGIAFIRPSQAGKDIE